ncbi:MAG: carbon-nitrogen hydrolase family protein [Methylococcaceae bacterium]
MTVKIATAQYDISFLETWENYQRKSERWVKQAAEQGAKIMMFPEYNTMELASLFPETIYSALNDQLTELQTLYDGYVHLFQGLAQQYQCYILAGTFPVSISEGVYHNRAHFFMPNGEFDFQDKIMMTRFENEHWLISAGNELKVFETEYGRIAINICYDSEFPLLARQQVEAGANLILVPSCTDHAAGYFRVKIACQARALENQCYVAQACLVGDALWSPAVDVNYGSAGVYTPVDYGFPDNGILASGEFNVPQWVYADIDLHNCEKIRARGQVFNYRDWSLQHNAVLR